MAGEEGLTGRGPRRAARRGRPGSPCARAVGSLSGTDPASLLVAEAYLAANRDERLRAELHEQLRRFRSGVGGWLAGHGVAAARITGRCTPALR